MKKILSVFFVLLLLFTLCLPAFAEMVIPDTRTAPYLVDNADLLSEQEEAEILQLLTENSGKAGMDIAILTVTSTGEKSAEDYADDYYDYSGFGTGKNRDGVLMLITAEPRYVHISGCGKCVRIFTTEQIDSLIDSFYFELRNDQFGSACEKFAANAASRIASFKARPFLLIAAALLIGFLISGAIVKRMKAQLGSVVMKSGAADYTVSDSMKLTQSDDRFLYNNIMRVKIASDSSRSGGGGGSHTSSSGTSHSGGGRSF